NERRERHIVDRELQRGQLGAHDQRGHRLPCGDLLFLSALDQRVQQDLAGSGDRLRDPALAAPDRGLDRAGGVGRPGAFLADRRHQSLGGQHLAPLPRRQLGGGDDERLHLGGARAEPVRDVVVGPLDAAEQTMGGGRHAAILMGRRASLTRLNGLDFEQVGLAWPADRDPRHHHHPIPGSGQIWGARSEAGCFGAARQIRAIARTASTGWAPTDVSLDSMTASVPSQIAFATSEASARVGRLEVTIDSSISVAVMTGTPARLARSITSFCTAGRSPSFSSTPRSPRATITASATSRIASRFLIASSFSSLAITGTVLL